MAYLFYFICYISHKSGALVSLQYAYGTYISPTLLHASFILPGLCCMSHLNMLPLCLLKGIGIQTLSGYTATCRMIGQWQTNKLQASFLCQCHRIDICFSSGKCLTNFCQTFILLFLLLLTSVKIPHCIVVQAVCYMAAIQFSLSLIQLWSARSGPCWTRCAGPTSK